MSSGVLTYDKVAVEQVFQLALWKHHRTTTHRVGDEVEGVDVDGAVVEAGVVGESENAVAVTHDNQRRHLRGPMLRSGHALQTASE